MRPKAGETMSKSRRVGSTVLGGALVSALTLTWAVSSAEAQATDGRWLPWLGCWEAIDVGAEGSDGAMLCVIPATTHSGVELTTVLPDGRASGPEPVQGDGVERSFSSDGCEGTRAAEFSDDGTRVYVHTEQVCEGDVLRATRGVFAMVTPYEWVDVQAVDADGRGSAWAMRYRAVSDERAEAVGQGAVLEGRRSSVRSARIGAARPPGVDDVADVYRHVGAEAAKAWVVEMNSPVDLNAERLIELSDTGVPGDVIDVVVAVSYPTRFSVDRDAGVRELQPEPAGYAARVPYYGYGYFGFNRWDPFYSSFYSPYGYRSGYGGYYGSYGYYRPTVIRVEPRNDGQMRVVNGRGWTRSQSTGTTGSGATSRTPTRRTTGSSAGAAGSSGRSSAGARSSGGSSRRGGSSTGRTARPRNGGD
jgi:hypothetical protein